MINSKYNRLVIGGEDYTEYFTFPFMVQRALDETLDFAVVELPNTRRKNPFIPFTPVEIGRGEHAMSFIGAIDEVEEKIGANRFKHTVTVMEYTKETERILCGAKAFTNPLVRDYSDGKGLVFAIPCEVYQIKSDRVEYSAAKSEVDYKSIKFFSPVHNGKVAVYYDSFGFNSDTITKIDVKVAHRQKGSPAEWDEEGGFAILDRDIIIEKTYTETLNQDPVPDMGEGIYGFIYTIYFGSGSTQILYFEVLSVAEPISRDPYTVEDVVNILLDTCETLREDLDSPRYRLRYKNDRQREIFRKAAPEFRFSNGRSLWECLREVGQYVHAIPRAIHDLTDGLDYIEFDELGGLERADLSKGTRYGGSSSVTVGDYTAGLEALAANLVNLDDEADGSMTEPLIPLPMPCLLWQRACPSPAARLPRKAS